MKKIKNLFFVSVLMLTLNVGCNRDESGLEPEPDQIGDTFEVFADYSLEGTSSEWTNLGDVNHSEGYLLIINSDEEMKSHVSGNYPPVDFSKRTLLLAYGTELHQDAPNERMYERISDNNYRMSVNLRPNAAPALLEWRVAILVDKLSDESEVELQITRNTSESIATRASDSSGNYYWYKGEKVYLTPNNELINVILQDGTIAKTSISGITSLPYRIQKYRLPFVERGSSVEPIGTSDIFYLKLKTASDITLLNSLANQHKVQVIKAVPHTPLWYILSIQGSDFANSIEASNYFYETGNFANVDPAFMFDFKPTDIPSDPMFNLLWGLHNTAYPDYDINAIEAWDLTGGYGIKVAVVDQGIDPNHNDLKSNFHSLSFDAQSGTTQSIYTGVYHGTHVAGIIAAVRNNGLQVVGVAHDSKIMRVSHDMYFSPTFSSELASGINWAWQNGADVINNSWGDRGGQYYHMVHSAILEEAIMSAMTQGRAGKGSVVVFAAGNFGEFMNYPANFHNDILTVGSINNNGSRSYDSAYGAMLDVVAPGSNILSTLPNNSTGYASGTSMAAPHVSGIAALILAKNPTFTRKQVVDKIEQFAQKIKPANYTYSTTAGRPNGTWNNQMGYGLVDAVCKYRVQVPYTYSTSQTNYYYPDMYQIYLNIVFTAPAIAYDRTIAVTYEEEWGGYGQHGTDIYEYTQHAYWPAGTSSASFSFVQYEDRNNFEQTLYKRIKRIAISSDDPNYYYFVNNGASQWNIPLATYLENLGSSVTSVENIQL